MGATITTRGFDELAATLGGMADRIERPAGVDRTVTGIMRARLAQRFAREGEGDWAPLAASTLAAKRRRGEDSRILRATGRMLRELLAGDAVATAGEIKFTPSTTGGYAPVVTATRQLLSGNEQTLAGRIADVLGAHVMGGGR